MRVFLGRTVSNADRIRAREGLARLFKSTLVPKVIGVGRVT